MIVYVTVQDSIKLFALHRRKNTTELHNMEPDGGSRGAATIADSLSGVQQAHITSMKTMPDVLLSNLTQC